MVPESVMVARRTIDSALVPSTNVPETHVLQTYSASREKATGRYDPFVGKWRPWSWRCCVPVCASVGVSVPASSKPVRITGHRGAPHPQRSSPIPFAP